MESNPLRTINPLRAFKLFKVYKLDYKVSVIKSDTTSSVPFMGINFQNGNQ